MALDRFVYWKKDERPTREDIERTVRNYFGEGAKVEWKTDRFYCTLPGYMSPAARGMPGRSPGRVAYDEEVVKEQRARWVEVWFDKDSIDVMTREQDDFTNAVADGLATLMQRWWGKD